VILSLVRSKHVGFIKDQSRMVVALSRARLGLYIIGNSELFKGCREVTPSLGKLLNGETQLILDDGTRISSCNQLYSIVAENLMKLEE
jgi:intron-binding protein aquarius